MNWKIIIGLITFYILWKANKFRVYINTYLIPRRVEIVSNEIKDGKYELRFDVLFVKGLFKKSYFYASAHLTSEDEFTEKMLNSMLTLTEINVLLNPAFKNADGTIIHNYRFSGAKKQISQGVGNYDIIYYDLEFHTSYFILAI